MTAINTLMAALVGALMSPFRTMHPMVGLTIVSAVVAVIMLLVFKRTSNQGAIDAIKRKIHASLFEIRLFNDDIRFILRAQLDILRHNLTYVRLSFVPFLWMFVPLTLLIAQLQFIYGYDAIHPGDKAMVKVKLKEGWDRSAPKPDATLAATGGVEVASDGVWVPEKGEMAWNVLGKSAGSHALELTWNGEKISKSVDVGTGHGKRSPFRYAPGFVNAVLYPVEPPLPASSPLESIEVRYADAEVGAFGWEAHWMIVFFILSLVIAFALRKPFGVTL